VRYAADRDFVLSVVSDCCADGKADVHRILIEEVIAHQAHVATAAEVIERIKALPK
jgi:nicotinamidase-related amidase